MTPNDFTFYILDGNSRLTIPLGILDRMEEVVFKLATGSFKLLFIDNTLMVKENKLLRFAVDRDNRGIVRKIRKNEPTTYEYVKVGPSNV